MGYTHYWHVKPVLNKNIFKKFANDVKKILTQTNIPLTYKVIENNNIITKNGFQITDNLINFNGKDDDEYETFYFTRIALPETILTEEKPRRSFNFCKTARKPYDILVTACLILAKHYFNNNIQIASDGNIGDWENGRKLIEQYLNCEVKITGTQIETANIEIKNICMSQTEIEEIFGKENTEEIQGKCINNINNINNIKDIKDIKDIENTEDIKDTIQNFYNL